MNRPDTPNPGPTPPRVFARILARWQELLVWVPMVVGALLLAQWLIPQLDPRAGVDGWGALWGMLLVVLAAVLAGFLAWLLLSTYTLELTDRDERELIDHACGIDRGMADQRIGAGPATWQAVAVLLGKQAAFLFLFALLFDRLAG